MYDLGVDAALSATEKQGVQSMAKSWMFALAILGIAAASPARADRQTERYTSVTVFGDSLVDAGNYYIATEGAMPDPALG